MNSPKPTRRDLVLLAAGSVAAAKAIAQTPTAPPNVDFYQQALESHKQNSQILAQVTVGMSVEPAFHFKA